MPEVGPLFSNPAIVSGGIGGIIAVLLIVIVFRMLVRIDDSIHAFTDGQQRVISGIDGVGEKVALAITRALERIHDDNVSQARDLGVIHGKLDVLLERTNLILQNVAYHRGVAEGAVLGTPPAILNPTPVATPPRERDRPAV